MIRCIRCDGQKWEIEKVPSTLYRCGYYTTARICRCCLGEGTIPVGEMDILTVSAGERVQK